MLQYSERFKVLDELFQQGSNFRLDESMVDVRFFEFYSNYGIGESRDSSQSSSLFDGLNEFSTDGKISENFSFAYPVFIPSGGSNFENCILMLHGLNERNWKKYLPWAEFLCHHTGKPVILFPIAFHVNRSPISWSNPRSLGGLLSLRKEVYKGERSISLANVALSERVTSRPERFYLSGRQTWNDLTALFEEAKSGRHPLFKEGVNIDIFAYSIGAMLSQVALMANQKNLFSDSKLFMFCGGSIFCSMQGVSRSILDKPAFEKLQNYYLNAFGNESAPFWKRDNAFNSFLSMISPERLKNEREKFFSEMKNKIRGIALAKDTVIPYHGILEALGSRAGKDSIEHIDFDFQYTHENPFPSNTKDIASLNKAFNNVFSVAAEFF